MPSEWIEDVREDQEKIDGYDSLHDEVTRAIYEEARQAKALDLGCGKPVETVPWRTLLHGIRNRCLTHESTDVMEEAEKILKTLAANKCMVDDGASGVRFMSPFEYGEVEDAVLEDQEETDEQMRGLFEEETTEGVSRTA